MQIAEIRHLKVITTTEPHFTVRHDPHIGKRQEAGLLHDLFRRLLIRRGTCTVG